MFSKINEYITKTQFEIEQPKTPNGNTGEISTTTMFMLLVTAVGHIITIGTFGGLFLSINAGDANDMLWRFVIGLIGFLMASSAGAHFVTTNYPLKSLVSAAVPVFLSVFALWGHYLLSEAILSVGSPPITVSDTDLDGYNQLQNVQFIDDGVVWFGSVTMVLNVLFFRHQMSKMHSNYKVWATAPFVIFLAIIALRVNTSGSENSVFPEISMVQNSLQYLVILATTIGFLLSYFKIFRSWTN